MDLNIGNYRIKGMGLEIDRDELVEQLLLGERSFYELKLKKNCDITRHPRFKEVLDALENPEFKHPPLDISHSIMVGINLTGISAQDTGALKCDLTSANLSKTDLSGSDFSSAKLQKANLSGAVFKAAEFENADLRDVNLVNANLHEANLTSANLQGADMKGCDVRGADFCNVNLKGVKNLALCKNLEFALFDKTKVSEKEKQIIEQAQAKREQFALNL